MKRTTLACLVALCMATAGCAHRYAGQPTADAPDAGPWQAISTQLAAMAKDNGTQITPTGDGALRVELPAENTFATASANVTPALRDALVPVARVLVQNPGLRAHIVGHTDATGDARLNMRLSQRRAEAVRRYLASQGIAARRLSAEGRGAAEPIGDNATEAGRAANRRIDIDLTMPDAAPQGRAGAPG